MCSLVQTKGTVIYSWLTNPELSTHYSRSFEQRQVSTEAMRPPKGVFCCDTVNESETEEILVSTTALPKYQALERAPTN